MFLEHEFILFARFDVAEESEINNETGVDRLGDCTVGEGVTMDLFDRSIAFFVKKRFKLLRDVRS